MAYTFSTSLDLFPVLFGFAGVDCCKRVNGVVLEEKRLKKLKHHNNLRWMCFMYICFVIFLVLFVCPLLGCFPFVWAFLRLDNGFLPHLLRPSSFNGGID
ncbi:hypothetical protein Sjap_010738 [Stephania japonica]|uniref:Transmembrane protein n=1 Tax=Stephania japonica TaxID=461633 RepID=A0AAP0JA01_9MAGN